MTNVTTMLDSSDAKSIDFELATVNYAENEYGLNLEVLTEYDVDETVRTHGLARVRKGGLIIWHGRKVTASFGSIY